MKIILTLLFFTTLLRTFEAQGPHANNYFYIWNVGQGSWSTSMSFESCFHFDAGGERWPRKQLLTLCKNKKNYLFLSHSDSDHMNGLSFLSQMKSICLHQQPKEKVLSERKQELLKQIPMCFELPEEIKEIKHSVFSKNRNSMSRVYSLFDYFLMPGDSTRLAEKQWAQALPKPCRIKLLILGHHGSNSSTSSFLLSELTELTMTVASARKTKYGHPHDKVIARLRHKKIGPILTEEWGHLIFDLTKINNNL
jgi:competence protein ComEC